MKFGLVGSSKVAILGYADTDDPMCGGIAVDSIFPGWVDSDLIEPQIRARAADHDGDRAMLEDATGWKKSSRACAPRHPRRSAPSSRS